MANEYFVNSADLTSVANAIRAKGETTEQLLFPDGFVAAIAGMETGKTGATLTVTTPAEGVTVTVTKGELSYTKPTGADGTAVFSGLESGTWTITISKGSQTATGSVDIDADYAAELTFFAATINVTYPVGLVCTATDGVTTLNAPDTSGTWACVVPNAGTWTISLDSGFAESVEITQKGEVQTVDKWYIYDNGDERTSYTGGYVMISGSDASITNNGGKLTITANLQGSHFGLKNTKDEMFKHFSVFCVKTGGVTGELSSIRIRKQNDITSELLLQYDLLANRTNNIDISSITTGCLIISAYKTTFEITEMYLEA